MSRTSRIIALNANLRDIIEFRQQEVDENGHPILAAGVGAGGAAALGTGALYGRGMMVQGPVRPGAQGFADRLGLGVQGFRQDASNVRGWATGAFDKPKAAATSGVNNVGAGFNTARTAVTGAGSQVGAFGQRIGKYASTVGGGIADVAGNVPSLLGSEARAAGVGMKDVAGYVGRGLKKVAQTRFSSRGRIVELNAILSDVIEFRANEYGQRPEDNWKRAAGIGVLTGGLPGALLTQPNASEAMRAGKVYRKRDAFTDSLRIGTGTAVGGLGGALAGYGIAGGGFTKAAIADTARMTRGMRGAPVGQLAGAVAGLGSGYLWARHANKARLARQQGGK